MSLDTYLRLRAAQAGRAQPRAARRHAHLAERPLVVTGYHLAGDPGAPVVLRYGTDATSGRTVVVPEPRDRQQRFERLAEFADDLVRYLAQFGERAPLERADGGGPDTEMVCTDAPQLVCPNPTTAEWLTDTLGRSLRFLRPDGPHPVDASLPEAGAHLTYCAGRRGLPGSAAVLAATELLTTHWVTGQLPAEDAELGAVLAWIDPPAGTGASSAAMAAAAGPSAGPVSDPGWDREVLQPLVGECQRALLEGVPPQAAVTELVAACNEALEPAWRGTWHALALLRQLPQAAHAPQRWVDDRRAWTRHLDRVAAGQLRFRQRLDQLQSYRFLHEWETRTRTVARQMALDDPLRLAAQVAAGDALSGVVVARDCGHRTITAKGREVVRPILWLRPWVPFHRPAGTRLWWVDDTRVRAQTVSVSRNGTVELMVVSGACASQPRAERILPETGQEMTLLCSGDEWFPDALPAQLPWTHQPAQEPAGDEAVDAHDPAAQPVGEVA